MRNSRFCFKGNWISINRQFQINFSLIYHLRIAYGFVILFLKG
uniref:Uncharacterized protein n=1 Tax=Anguilla anguilla TaxID=7936 RepID=A0A0E9PVT7_ANGAN